MFCYVVCALSLLVLCASAGQIIQTVDSYRQVYRSWPQLVGVPTDEASITLLRDIPGLKIMVRKASLGIVSDLLVNQVYLFENDKGQVVKVPETLEKVPYQIVLMRWPEAVGLTSERAKEVIRRDQPNAYFQVVPEGSPVTLDLRYDRVRLFVNADDVVVYVPSNG